jgi:hypothetical protein
LLWKSLRRNFGRFATLRVGEIIDFKTPGQHPASSAQGLSSHTTAPTTPNLVGVAGSLWKRVYENFSANEDPLLDDT